MRDFLLQQCCNAATPLCFTDIIEAPSDVRGQSLADSLECQNRIAWLQYKSRDYHASSAVQFSCNTKFWRGDTWYTELTFYRQKSWYFYLDSMCEMRLRGSDSLRFVFRDSVYPLLCILFSIGLKRILLPMGVAVHQRRHHPLSNICPLTSGYEMSTGLAT